MKECKEKYTGQRHLTGAEEEITKLCNKEEETERKESWMKGKRLGRKKRHGRAWGNVRNMKRSG